MKTTFITVCKGRLSYLEKTYRRNIETVLRAGIHAEFVLLDYSCPENTADWATANLADVSEVAVYRLLKEEPHWSSSISQNLAASCGSGDWLVNLLADNILSDSFCQALSQSQQKKSIFCHGIGSCNFQCYGTLALPMSDFWEMGGYNEEIRGWAYEDGDLIIRSELHGLTRTSWPDSSITAIPHSDELRLKFTENSNRTIAEIVEQGRIHYMQITSSRTNLAGRTNRVLSRVK